MASDALTEYIEEQMAKGHKHLAAYVYDLNGKAKVKREVYYELEKYLIDFLNGDATRIFILTGLRGAGKTTLLAQLFHYVQNCSESRQEFDKFYASADDINNLLDSSIHDLLQSYQKMSSTSFSTLKRPLVLFLDEIQDDPKWAITLKSLYDKSRQVFIFATGSSALQLQQEVDLARRAIFIDIEPLSFKEYLSIKHGHQVDENISNLIKEAIFYSKSAEESYSKLEASKADIFRESSKIDQYEIDRYMKCGSLPFALESNNESLIYLETKRLVNRIINLDIKGSANFSSEVLNKIPQLLYTIAEADNTNIESLSKTLQLSRPTISEILETLEQAAAIHRVYPYGSHAAQARKSSKYLFTTPLLRSLYFNSLGSVNKNYLSKLLEDTTAMYFKSFLRDKINGSLTYDSSKDSADFILAFGSEKIIIEVGTGEKDFRQIYTSFKKVSDAKYGLNISKTELKLSEDKRALSVPLEYFFLV